MSFDPTPITSQSVAVEGDALRVSWTSSAPAGSTYQLYVDRVLAWEGAGLSAVVPYPQSRTTFAVGVVAPADAATDFSAGLSPDQPTAVTLSWAASLALSATLTRFDVYRSLAPGQPVSYLKPVAAVAAYEGGVVTDGLGPLPGLSSYSWTSPPLGPGTWRFGVVAVDLAGNAAIPGQECSSTLSGAPRPPAAAANRARLSYTLDPATLAPTLSWLPSPP